MLSIEHDFAATVLTLVDEGPAPLLEDVVILASDGGVTIEQYDPDTDRTVRIQMSMSMLRDLQAGLHLPEGVWRAEDDDDDEDGDEDDGPSP